MLINSGSTTSHETLSEEKINMAIKSVVGGMNVRRATLDYYIPKSTLYDRLFGKIKTEAKSGAQHI